MLSPWNSDHRRVHERSASRRYAWVHLTFEPEQLSAGWLPQELAELQMTAASQSANIA